MLIIFKFHQRNFMKKLCLLLIILSGFTVKSIAQTVHNKTKCAIKVEIACVSGTPCIGTYQTFQVIYPGQTYNFTPGNMCNGLINTELHFYFYPSPNCNLDDPFVGYPGNCLSLPKMRQCTANAIV